MSHQRAVGAGGVANPHNVPFEVPRVLRPVVCLSMLVCKEGNVGGVQGLMTQ